MRISGGSARGIPLKTPGGLETRPATESLRAAVCDALAARGVAFSGAAIVDFFAGSGAYGLEAASRGASHISFVENNRAAAACIKHNMAAVTKAITKTIKETLHKEPGATEAARPPAPVCTLRTQCALRAAPSLLPAADIVFADPPYHVFENYFNAPTAKNIPKNNPKKSPNKNTNKNINAHILAQFLNLYAQHARPGTLLVLEAPGQWNAEAALENIAGLQLLKRLGKAKGRTPTACIIQHT